LTTEKQIEKGISEIVGALTDPIIVFPGGWGDTLPEWLKAAITLERMMENMKALKGEEPIGTDAEACAYLMTVSLTQPVDSSWTQIYLYIAGQTYQRWNKGEMPADIAVDSISDYQTGELKRLKAWLHRQRIKARTERDRAQRRQEKEKVEAAKKTERPVLFEF
jgi:predicted transcriptional regulator